MRAIVLLVIVCAACALAQVSPQLAGCAVFPADNIWNVPVDALPVDASSAAYVNTIDPARPLHPDFGTGLIGIPYVTVPGNQPNVPVTFDYSDESDPGPYPIPPNPPIEGGPNSTGDRHILVLDRDNCVLYESYAAYQSGGTWRAGSGAIFDLKSNALRTLGWTSADAAGLPILPGLVRYDEVASGEIRHAIRFTAPKTQRRFVWPATHFASSITDANYPPMGQRFRLRADFDTSGFSRETQVILRALKKYGMILADNGSAWFISGAPDERWNNEVLVTEMRRVKGADFEAVDTTSLESAPTTGQVRRAAWNPQIVNAASYRAGAVSPGELISIFGTNLGPADAVPLRLTESGLIDTSLGGTRVLFDGDPAPLLYVQALQVNAVVPYSVAGKPSTLLEVEYNGAKMLSETVDVAPAAPSIFTRDASGKGLAAVLNWRETGSVPNSAQDPVERGAYIEIYATGGGQTNPPGVDGKLGGAKPPEAVPEVLVRIGGIEVTPSYKGGSGDLVAGVLQVNAQVPLQVAPGDAVPVQLTINGINSQPEVTIAVK